ncbi:MAG: outer membrane beta-barrel protein [Flavobacterium sp.]
MDDENVLIGFNGGLVLDLPLSKPVSIQSEVTYGNLLTSGLTKFRLDYIEVLVLLKVKLLPRFNIHYGPYVAFLLDSKIKNESNNSSFNFEQNIDKSDLNTSHTDLAIGTGIELGNFGIGIRYNYDLKRVGKERNYSGISYAFTDVKNGVLNIFETLKF